MCTTCDLYSLGWGPWWERVAPSRHAFSLLRGSPSCSEYFFEFVHPKFIRGRPELLAEIVPDGNLALLGACTLPGELAAQRQGAALCTSAKQPGRRGT